MAKTKNANFATFLNQCFYSEERLVFYIECDQTLFQRIIYLKKEHEIPNFDQNLWKNANFVTYLYPSLYGQERQFFYLESNQTAFLGQMSLKRENKQISNFWPNYA